MAPLSVSMMLRSDTQQLFAVCRLFFRVFRKNVLKVYIGLGVVNH
jgi:hypothetical protein